MSACADTATARTEIYACTLYIGSKRNRDESRSQRLASLRRIRDRNRNLRTNRHRSSRVAASDDARDQANVFHSERRVDLLPRVNVNSYRPIKTDYPHFVLFPFFLSLYLFISLSLSRRRIASPSGTLSEKDTALVSGKFGNDVRRSLEQLVRTTLGKKCHEAVQWHEKTALLSPRSYVRRNNTRYTRWTGIRNTT